MPPNVAESTPHEQRLLGPLKTRLLRALDSNRLASEFEPIVEATSEKIVAYEALARFTLDGESIPPNEVFHSIHTDPELFFMLEARMKSFQLAHRPGRNSRLFVNIDPDVCDEPHQLKHWSALFEAHENVIVEIIENTNITNLASIRNFTKHLNETGIPVALDDIGGAHNLFAFDLLENCDYLKLDRRWFVFLAREPAYRTVASGLVQFAKARGIRTVIEGVETRQQFSVAKSLGIDLVQGFLFRDAFLHVTALHSSSF